MQYIICYDITENKIRNKVVKLLEGVALRVQYSIFLGNFDDKTIRQLKSRLSRLTEGSEHSLLMVVPLCKDCFAKIWKQGSFIEEIPDCILV